MHRWLAWFLVVVLVADEDMPAVTEEQQAT
jgi:hypothetical protein